MKFSEIKREDWASLAPYLDTCLLPVSGLGGEESPVEAADRLEQLRDLLDLLERPFRGRTVTYPAWHYVPDIAAAKEQIARTVRKLRGQGFRFIIIVTVMEQLAELQGEADPDRADLVITPARAERVHDLVTELWNRTDHAATADL
mgnify:CR=1 FL=1